MGVFHCPFGCPHHEAEGCIDCGLCAAATNEEMVEAYRKIREYLKAHTGQGGPVRKIAVCGKGGAGKSAMVALLANALTGQGRNVFVLDTDESNPGLYRAFGFERTPKPLLSLMSRFSYTGEPAPDTFWIMLPEIGSADVPPDYCLSRNGLHFLMVGKIEHPFQGCACSMADVTRGLVSRLTLKEDEILLIDTEAGVESFGRGVERSVDLVLVIVEPSFESMALAEKIVYMAEGMGIDRVGAILNKVPSEEIGEKMRVELGRRNVPAIGTVHYDPEVFQAGFEGRPPGDSRAQREAGEVAEFFMSIVQRTASA